MICTRCKLSWLPHSVQVKKMIHAWERQYPGRIDNMFTAMGNIVPSHMMDRKLFPFTALQATGLPDARGDRAFDDDESCATPVPASQVVTFLKEPMP